MTASIEIWQSFPAYQSGDLKVFLGFVSLAPYRLSCAPRSSGGAEHRDRPVYTHVPKAHPLGVSIYPPPSTCSNPANPHHPRFPRSLLPQQSLNPCTSTVPVDDCLPTTRGTRWIGLGAIIRIVSGRIRPRSDGVGSLGWVRRIRIRRW